MSIFRAKMKLCIELRDLSLIFDKSNDLLLIHRIVHVLLQQLSQHVQLLQHASPQLQQQQH